MGGCEWLDRDVERCTEALLGAAVGDALGAPVEFLPREEVARRHGTLRDMVGGGQLGWRPGEWTDDTAMTLAVAEGLLDAPGDLDGQVAAIGERFLAWRATRPKDMGTTIAQALAAFAGDWPAAARGTLAARQGRAAGNGSLMRSLPVALAFADEPAFLAASARVSAMTHFDCLAETCCAVHGLWVRGLLAGAGKAEAWEAAVARGRELAARDAVVDPLLAPGWAGPTHPAWDRLAGAPELDPSRVQPSGYAGFAVECLEAAACLVLRSGSFEEALVAVVNLGGETDTIATVAGGPAALAFGPGAIPGRWLHALEQRGRIEAAGAGLARLRHGLPPRP